MPFVHEASDITTMTVGKKEHKFDILFIPFYRETRDVVLR